MSRIGGIPGSRIGGIAVLMIAVLMIATGMDVLVAMQMAGLDTNVPGMTARIAVGVMVPGAPAMAAEGTTDPGAMVRDADTMTARHGGFGENAGTTSAVTAAVTKVVLVTIGGAMAAVTKVALVTIGGALAAGMIVVLVMTSAVMAAVTNVADGRTDGVPARAIRTEGTRTRTRWHAGHGRPRIHRCLRRSHRTCSTALHADPSVHSTSTMRTSLHGTL